MNKLILSSLALAVSLTLVSSPPMAQSTYQSWENPDQPSSQNSETSNRIENNAAADERLKTFIDQLNKLVGQAEKDKAADLIFLGDLRDLVHRYDNTWPNLALHDDFLDGNFTQNPTWTVSSGRYFIEKGWGGTQRTGYNQNRQQQG